MVLMVDAEDGKTSIEELFGPVCMCVVFLELEEGFVVVDPVLGQWCVPSHRLSAGVFNKFVTIFVILEFVPSPVIPICFGVPVL